MKPSDSPSRLRASLIEEVSRQLIADLEALQTSLPSGPPRSAAAPVPSGAPAEGVEPFSLDGPRTLLEGGARFVAPFLPAETRFRAAKALILRSLRIVTRDQTVFNSALTEAFRVALREIETGILRSREREAADVAKLREDVRAASESLEGISRDAAEERQTLSSRIDELEGPHGALGHLSRAVEALEGRAEAAERSAVSESRAREALSAAFDRRLEERDASRSALARELYTAIEKVEKELEREGAARNALARDHDRRFEHQDAMRTALSRELAVSLEREAASREQVSVEMERRLEHQERMRAALAAELHGVLKGEEKARELVGAELSRALARLDRLESENDHLEDVTKDLARGSDSSSRQLALVLSRLDSLAEDVRLSRLEWTSLRSSLRSQAAAGPAAEPVAASSPAAASASPLDAGLYAGFEERFRGREDVIRERQGKDARLFQGSPGLVVDLGCGRGEFLEALRELGIAAEGCDTNGVAVARARQKGLRIAEEDLFDFLERQPDASLGGITAFQVVEHLPPAALVRLVELSAIKLAPGGKVLFETVNPESVFAMKWFWMDLTHVRPVPGGSLEQLLRAGGFRDVRLDYRSPVPPESAPPPEVFEDPRLRQMAELLFAAQDVAVIGEK